MNYLGHAYLSFGDGELLAGNMIGDHVKGSQVLAGFPMGVRNGVLLHRHIDAYTDRHPSIARVKELFRPDYGLYSGAIADTLMDYFLANDRRIFPDDAALLAFSQETYRSLDMFRSVFPESFLPYFASMRQHNWLYNYGSEEGIGRSMNGLQRRARHMPAIDAAMATFRRHKTILQDCYQPFISDAVDFVKITVNELQAFR